MTATVWWWVALAGLLAVISWVAVLRESRRISFVGDSGAMLCLVGAGVSAHPPDPGVHNWLLAALVFTLIGTMALYLGPLPAPDAKMSARSNRFFLGGLASFIIGHFCYGRALLGHGIQNLGIIFGLALSLLVTASLGHHLFVAAGRRAGSKLAFAVVMYLITLGSVVVLAIGTASVWIAYGGMIFAVSAISVTSYRFLSPKAWAQLAIVVGCHLGQALMLIGLAR